MTKRLKIIVWVMAAIALLILLFYDRSRVINRRNNPVITEGTITGKGDRAKTDSYVAYVFYVDEKQYKGSVNVEFCNECKNNCCEIGAKVKVRYEKGKPENNDLIH